MENILAERTVTVEREGEPTTSLRITIGHPVKTDVDYQIQIEVHGPDDDALLTRSFSGSDEWQAIRIAFRIVYDLACVRVKTGSRLTFDGDDNWTSEQSAPVPHW